MPVEVRSLRPEEAIGPQGGRVRAAGDLRVPRAPCGVPGTAPNNESRAWRGASRWQRACAARAGHGSCVRAPLLRRRGTAS